MNTFRVPKEILTVTETLRTAGFQAYLVGGCVRDMIVQVKPKDWDVATDATPEEIQKVFPHAFYENDYGTVGVVNDDAADETLKVVEVTPFRIEGKYTDGRRPDTVHFSKNLSDDLKRRDFTMNAVAYNPAKNELVDPFGGQAHIKDKMIVAVGEPEERFAEDYLRMLRAVRFSAELGFAIEARTMDAIRAHAKKIAQVSAERVREEFSKLVMSARPKEGIEVAHEVGILAHIAPEMEKGISVEQNGDHIYDVWEHNLRALQHSAERGWPLQVRLAAMLHDVSKPETRRWSKEKNDWTFYGHDVVGGRVARAVLTRLKYPKETVENVSKLVRYHLFFSDIEKITLSAVRRIVSNVGPELVWDLMDVRACDRIGMGRPKETPYRLRKYHSMIEEAMRAPVSVGMLKIDGAKIMEVTGEKPGPRLGWILHALLEEALENPDINTADGMETRAQKLAKLSDTELRTIGEAGKKKKDEEEEKELAEIRKRYGVK